MDPAIEQRFKQYWAATQAGHNFTQALKNRHDYGNPYLLESVQAEFRLAQHGTGMEPTVWDPDGFQQAEYYEQLGQAQAEATDAARARAATRTAVSFVSTGPQHVGLPPQVAGLAQGRAGGAGEARRELPSAVASVRPPAAASTSAASTTATLPSSLPAVRPLAASTGPGQGDVAGEPPRRKSRFEG